MDFSINFTLIIQAVNFIVAFIILNKFFLSPAVNLLLIEDIQMRQLKGSIIFDQDRLRSQKELVLSSWQDLQKDLHADQPRIAANEFLGQVNFLQEDYELRDISVEQTAKYLSDIIVQKAKAL